MNDDNSPRDIIFCLWSSFAARNDPDLLGLCVRLGRSFSLYLFLTRRGQTSAHISPTHTHTRTQNRKNKLTGFSL